MNTLDKYRSSMLVEYDFRKGSLADQSGNGKDITMTDARFNNSERGRTMDFSKDSAVGSFTTTRASDNMTMIVLAKADSTSSSDNVWLGSPAGGNLAQFDINDDNSMRLYMSGCTPPQTETPLTTSTILGDYYVYGVSRADDGAINFFLNGSVLGTSSMTGTNTADWGLLGNVSTGTKPWEGDIAYTAIIDEVVSEEDMALIYEELITEVPYTAVDFKSVSASTGMADGVVQAYIADGKGWNESMADVTSGFIENTDFQIQTTTPAKFQVKDVDGFNKKLASTLSNSSCSHPCSQAYGTWEFTLYQKDNTSQPYVNFMMDRFEGGSWSFLGYQFVVSTSGVGFLRRANNGSATILVSSALAPSSEVQIKITRDTSGEFELFYDGVSQGTLTDNTYSTCTYTGLLLDSGDYIRNFKFIPYIQ